jgi:hypothetical protein
MNIHANILSLVHKGAPFGRCDANDQNLPQSGRLLYCVIIPVITNCAVRLSSASEALARLLAPVHSLDYDQCVRPALIVLFLLPVIAAAALPKDHRAGPPVPDRFVIGRDTFFDFGPPFHYVELIFVNPDGDGTSIERAMLTAGYKCTLAQKIQVAKARLKQSVADLFGATNPCTIPEKDLNRELKRRKHYLVFSGANISMLVLCGGQTRIIRSSSVRNERESPLIRSCHEPRRGPQI